MKGGMCMEYTLGMTFLCADDQKVSLSIEGIRPTYSSPNNP